MHEEQVLHLRHDYPGSHDYAVLDNYSNHLCDLSVPTSINPSISTSGTALSSKWLHSPALLSGANDDSNDDDEPRYMQ